MESPDITDMAKIPIGTMKKPAPEDFMTRQEYEKAQKRLADLRQGRTALRFGLVFLASILGALLIAWKTAEPVDCFFVALVILFLSLCLILRWYDAIRLNKELSKPIYGKIRLYEDALDQYQKTTEQYWKSLREIAFEMALAEEQYWKSLRGIDFETALADLYRNMGYSVRQTKGSGDEGIDLILQNEGAKTVVQCKGHSKPVGVGAVRDLYGAMMHFDADSAILACPAGFTEGVVQFVAGKSIQLVSVRELVDMAERKQQLRREAVGRDKPSLGKKNRKEQQVHEAIDAGKTNFDLKSRRIKDGLEELGKKYKCAIHTYGLGRYDVSSKNRSLRVDVCEEYVDVFIEPYHIHTKRLNLYETKQVEIAVKEIECILEGRSQK